MSTEQQRELTIAAPAGWEQIEGALGSEVAFVAPAEPGSFRPNVNVVVQSLDAVVTLPELAASHQLELEEVLTAARVLDAGFSEVGGVAASRVLATYTDNAEDLTLEQWIVPFPGRTVVVSATCTNVAYAALAPEFGEIVASIAFADA